MTGLALSQIVVSRGEHCLFSVATGGGVLGRSQRLQCSGQGRGHRDDAAQPREREQLPGQAPSTDP